MRRVLRADQSLPFGLVDGAAGDCRADGRLGRRGRHARLLEQFRRPHADRPVLVAQRLLEQRPRGRRVELGKRLQDGAARDVGAVAERRAVRLHQRRDRRRHLQFAKSTCRSRPHGEIIRLQPLHEHGAGPGSLRGDQRAHRRGDDAKVAVLQQQPQPGLRARRRQRRQRGGFRGPDRPVALGVEPGQGRQQRIGVDPGQRPDGKRADVGQPIGHEIEHQVEAVRADQAGELRSSLRGAALGQPWHRARWQ